MPSYAMGDKERSGAASSAASVVHTRSSPTSRVAGSAGMNAPRAANARV